MKTLSGAQMHQANEAAYRANPLLHWPEEETYNLAVETDNWSEYDARYGNDDDSLMLDEQFFFFYDDDEVEDL